MKKLMVVLAGLFLTACGADNAAEFRTAVPSSDSVALKAPGEKANQSGLSQQELAGEKAAFYTFTRGITVVVNGGTGFALNLVREIAKHTPTSFDGTTAVWGPHTEALSPNTYRFTAVKLADHKFSYKLEAKAKTADDTGYVTFLSGEHTKSVDANGVEDENHGSGNFKIDWTAAATLPEHNAKETGTAVITYSRLSAADPTTIDVVFTQVKDEESGKLIDATYKYAKQVDDSGAFQFSIVKNIYGDELNLETMSIRSRWQPTGAGRSDIRASGGDINSNVDGNECWDANFASTFLKSGWAPISATTNWGVETTCAFPTAEYAQ